MLKRTLTWYFSGWYLGRSARLLLAAAVLLVASASPVWAQDGDEDSDDSGEVAEPDAPMAEEVPVDPNAVRHGVGLRLRYVFVPKGLIQLFMEEAAGGMGNPGFGLDYIRRKGNFEFSVGFEYDKLSGTEGYYVESGGSALKAGTTDFVEFDSLSWFTVDASFVYHHPLSKLVSLRYGGGIGLGYVSGEVIKTDSICTGPSAQSDCAPVPTPIPGGDFNSKQDFFRFPPVFNLVGGVQLTPAPNVAINFELGMRTVFYSGISGQYFF
jgi:opacity protein-like surface antigen